MMITGKSGMRFSTDKIKQESKEKKFTFDNVFFACASLYLALFGAYMIIRIGWAVL